MSMTETLLKSPLLHCLFNILGKLNSENRDRLIQIIRRSIGRLNIFKEDREVREFATILDVFHGKQSISFDIEDSIQR